MLSQLSMQLFRKCLLYPSLHNCEFIVINYIPEVSTPRIRAQEQDSQGDGIMDSWSNGNRIRYVSIHLSASV